MYTGVGVWGDCVRLLVQERVEDLGSAGGLTKWPHSFWTEPNISLFNMINIKKIKKFENIMNIYIIY